MHFLYFIKANQSLLILFPFPIHQNSKISKDPTFLNLNPRFLSRRKTPPPSSPPSIIIKEITFFFQLASPSAELFTQPWVTVTSV